MLRSPNPQHPHRRTSGLSLPAFTQHFFERVCREYGDTYQAGDYFNEAGFRSTQAAVSRAIEGTRAGRVLDTGCGTGLMAAPWCAGTEVVGLDFARAPLAVARARLAPVESDATSLPLRAETFGVGLSVSVIQHLEPPDGLAALVELVRVVAPGGTVVVATLNALSAVRRVLPPRFGGKGYTTYSPVDLQHALTDAGVDGLQWTWLYHPFGMSCATDGLRKLCAWTAPSFVVAGTRR